MLSQKVPKEVATKAEMIMMGFAQPVADNDEAKAVLSYMLTVMKNCNMVSDNEEYTAEHILQQAFRFCEDPVVKLVHIGKVSGFLMIALPMQTAEEEDYDLFSTDGAFSYVFNLDAPDLSELGYCFFSSNNGVIHRRG